MFLTLHYTLINLFSEQDPFLKFIKSTSEVQMAVKATGTTLFYRALKM